MFENAEWDGWGTVHISGLRNTRQLREMIQPHFLRRKRKDVLTELPPKIRQPLYVTMEPAQAKIYNGLAQTMMAELADEKDSAKLLMVSGTLDQLTRLRQTLVTPALYGGLHSSAGIDAIADSIDLDFDAGLNVMVFCPFAKALPFIQDALEDVCGAQTFVLQGSTPQKDRQSIKDKFQRPNTHRKALICSLAVATSFTATEASVGYFLGYGWNPAVNEQAEDRMCRIGQTRGAIMRYVVHRGTVDEHVLSIIERKHTWAQLITDPHRLLQPHDTSTAEFLGMG